MSVSFESAPAVFSTTTNSTAAAPWHVAPALRVITAMPPTVAPAAAAPVSPRSVSANCGPTNRAAAMVWAVRRRNALVPLELLPPVPLNALVTSFKTVHVAQQQESAPILTNPFANSNNNSTSTTDATTAEQTPTSPASPLTLTRTSPTSPTGQQVGFFFSPAPNKRPRLGRRRSSCTQQSQQRSPPHSPSACATVNNGSAAAAAAARNVTYFPRGSPITTPLTSGVETQQETQKQSEVKQQQDSKMTIDTPSITTDEVSPPSYTSSLKAADPRREQRSTVVVTVRIANDDQSPPAYVSSYFSGTAKASTDPSRQAKEDQFEHEESTPASAAYNSPSSAAFVPPTNALSPPPTPRLKHRPLSLPLSLRKPRFLSLQARSAPLPPLPNVNVSHVRSRAEGTQALPPSEILRQKRPFGVLLPPPPGSFIPAAPRRIAPVVPVVAPKPAWNKPRVSSGLAICVPIVPSTVDQDEEEDVSMEMALGATDAHVYVPGTLLPANFPGSAPTIYSTSRLPPRSSSLSRSSTQISRGANGNVTTSVRPRSKARSKNGKGGSRVAMLRWAVLNHSGPEVGRRIMGMGVRLAQEVWEAERAVEEEDNRLAAIAAAPRRKSVFEDDEEDEPVEKQEEEKEETMMDVKEEQSFLLATATTTTTTTEEHPIEGAINKTADVVVEDIDMEGRDAIVPLSERAQAALEISQHSAQPVEESKEEDATTTTTTTTTIEAAVSDEETRSGLMSYEERARLADECIRELEEQMKLDDQEVVSQVETITTDTAAISAPTVSSPPVTNDDIEMVDANVVPNDPTEPKHDQSIEVERPEVTTTNETEHEKDKVQADQGLAPSSLDFIASLPILPRDRNDSRLGLGLSMDLDPDPLWRHPLSNASQVRLRLVDFRTPSSSRPHQRRARGTVATTKNGKLAHLATISSSMATLSITKRWFERIYL